MKLSLIERSALTLENYIDGKMGSHFLSEKFLDGIAEQRNEISRRQARVSSRLFLLTTILAFFSNITGNVTFLGASVRISPEFASALSTLVAAGLVATVFALLDQIILDRYVTSIGKKVGMFSFPIFLLHKTAFNLWIDPLMPRYYGPKSRRPQHLAMRLMLIFAIFQFLIVIIYPTSVCGYQVWKIFTENSANIEMFFGVMTLLLLTYAAFNVLVFCLKFRFDAAEFNESDGQPTDEFLAFLRAEEAKRAS